MLRHGVLQCLSAMMSSVCKEVTVSNKDIRIRCVEANDLDTLLLWENDPEVRKHTTAEGNISKELLREFIEECQHDIREFLHVRYMILVKGKSIGCIDLYDYDGISAQIGILIYEERYRRKGIASFALEYIKSTVASELSLLLIAHIKKENVPSIALFTKASFSLLSTDTSSVTLALQL